MSHDDTTIHLLSGGAAQSLVGSLRPRFEQESGWTLDSDFGAVGLMRDRFLAGEPCDVLILTAAIVQALETQGEIVPGSARPVGTVRTGIAVREGSPMPDVGTPEALAAALRAATDIYHPDPVKATAGIHFHRVLQQLGLDVELADRLRPYPNGATAMAALARSEGRQPIGCTQVTEILYTPGARLVAVLPQVYELATVYTAAITTRARPEPARALIELITGPASAMLRRDGGFE